jgi:hypothetical protein
MATTKKSLSTTTAANLRKALDKAPAAAPFTSKFTKTAVKFVTNSPTSLDNKSGVVVITSQPTFNTFTQSLEVTSSDGRMRQCRYERLISQEQADALDDAIQTAFDKQIAIRFIAAGGANANVWFYAIERAVKL